MHMAMTALGRGDATMSKRNPTRRGKNRGRGTGRTIRYGSAAGNTSQLNENDKAQRKEQIGMAFDAYLAKGEHDDAGHVRSLVSDKLSYLQSCERNQEVSRSLHAGAWRQIDEEAPSDDVTEYLSEGAGGDRHGHYVAIRRGSTYMEDDSTWCSPATDDGRIASDLKPMLVAEDGSTTDLYDKDISVRSSAIRRMDHDIRDLQRSLNESMCDVSSDKRRIRDEYMSSVTRPIEEHRESEIDEALKVGYDGGYSAFRARNEREIAQNEDDMRKSLDHAREASIMELADRKFLNSYARDRGIIKHGYARTAADMARLRKAVKRYDDANVRMIRSDISASMDQEHGRVEDLKMKATVPYSGDFERFYDSFVNESDEWQDKATDDGTHSDVIRAQTSLFRKLRDDSDNGTSQYTRHMGQEADAREKLMARKASKRNLERRQAKAKAEFAAKMNAVGSEYGVPQA